MAQRHSALGRAAGNANHAGAGSMQAAGDRRADEARHADDKDGLADQRADGPGAGSDAESFKGNLG